MRAPRWNLHRSSLFCTRQNRRIDYWFPAQREKDDPVRCNQSVDCRGIKWTGYCWWWLNGIFQPLQKQQNSLNISITKIQNFLLHINLCFFLLLFFHGREDQIIAQGDIENHECWQFRKLSNLIRFFWQFLNICGIFGKFDNLLINLYRPYTLLSGQCHLLSKYHK